MPTLNIVVSAWAIKIEIVPSLKLKLAIDPCAVEVLDKAVDLWDLLADLLNC
jgi:hypothetical protein